MYDTEGDGKWKRVRRWLPAADPAHLYPRVTSSRTMAALLDVVGHTDGQ